MKKNVGAFDGAARMLAGILLIVCGILFNSPWLALLAIIPIITAVAMWCPFYELLGISSDKQQGKHA